jgi:predicted metal-binding membrane protein
VPAVQQQPIRDFTVALRWRPEWPYLVLVLLAWVALLAGVGGHGGAPPASDDPEPPELAAAAHEHHHAELATTVAQAPGAGHSSGGLSAALAGWTLMSVAMMVPVVLPAVRHVGLNSLRQRRQWAMFVFFAVYAGTWAAFGILALGWQRLTLRTIGIDARVLLTGTLVVAAGWQLTRVKRRALLACRRTVPLPPIGRRADAGCARFALRQSRRCMASCWALMAVMVAVQQAAVVWMLSLTALMAAEELTRPGRRGGRLLPLSAGALAVVAGMVALSVRTAG